MLIRIMISTKFAFQAQAFFQSPYSTAPGLSSIAQPSPSVCPDPSVVKFWRQNSAFVPSLASQCGLCWDRTQSSYFVDHTSQS